MQRFELQSCKPALFYQWITYRKNRLDKCVCYFHRYNKRTFNDCIFTNIFPLCKYLCENLSSERKSANHKNPSAEILINIINNLIGIILNCRKIRVAPIMSIKNRNNDMKSVLKLFCFITIIPWRQSAAMQENNRFVLHQSVFSIFHLYHPTPSNLLIYLFL